MVTDGHPPGDPADAAAALAQRLRHGMSATGRSTALKSPAPGGSYHSSWRPSAPAARPRRCPGPPEGRAEYNRATFLQLLGTQWLPAIADVDRRLRREPPARVADLACGAGWSSIAIAQAYPLVRVDGLDLDPDVIAAAGRNAEEAGWPGGSPSPSPTPPARAGRAGTTW
jgi:SAM-dependent methyltransferase